MYLHVGKKYDFFSIFYTQEMITYWFHQLIWIKSIKKGTFVRKSDAEGFFFMNCSHLNADHALDERSTAQARVQMQVVMHLEFQVFNTTLMIITSSVTCDLRIKHKEAKKMQMNSILFVQS